MEHIVVGVDSSPRSQRALRWALDEACLRGCPLTTVLVWDEPVSLEVPLDRVTAGALRYDVRAGRSMPETSARALPGSPGRVLVEQAEGAALLVLGVHRPARPFRSVASYCLRHGHTPVVVVSAEVSARRGRMVVGVDGSLPSERALRWAASVARSRDAELVVVQAWQHHPRSAGDLVHPRQARRREQARATDRLTAWVCAVLGPEGASGTRVRAEHGGPLDRLLEQAGSADLLVLGGQAHHTPLRALLSSLGGQLAQHSPCPVVVVPFAAAAC
jgi:nucleotide-binding universal stress UspA family protein